MQLNASQEIIKLFHDRSLRMVLEDNGMTDDDALDVLCAMTAKSYDRLEYASEEMIDYLINFFTSACF